MLSTLLQHGALPEDAIAFLWQLTEGGCKGSYSICSIPNMHRCAELFC